MPYIVMRWRRLDGSILIRGTKEDTRLYFPSELKKVLNIKPDDFLIPYIRKLDKDMAKRRWFDDKKAIEVSFFYRRRLTLSQEYLYEEEDLID